MDNFDCIILLMRTSLLLNTDSSYVGMTKLSTFHLCILESVLAIPWDDVVTLCTVRNLHTIANDLGCRAREWSREGEWELTLIIIWNGRHSRCRTRESRTFRDVHSDEGSILPFSLDEEHLLSREWICDTGKIHVRYDLGFIIFTECMDMSECELILESTLSGRESLTRIETLDITIALIPWEGREDRVCPVSWLRRIKVETFLFGIINYQFFIIHYPGKCLPIVREKCIDTIISRSKEDLPICDISLEKREELFIVSSIRYLLTECIDKSRENILRRSLLSIAGFDESRHERRKIVLGKWYRYSWEHHSTESPEHFFYDSLMQCYPDRHCRISGFLDKGICLLECISKVWIIVHVSKSIVSWDESKSWRREFLVWVEIPVIVVDVIRTEVFDISLIYCKCDDTSWESTIGSDLITILIEDDISLWSISSE